MNAVADAGYDRDTCLADIAEEPRLIGARNEAADLGQYPDGRLHRGDLRRVGTQVPRRIARKDRADGSRAATGRVRRQSASPLLTGSIAEVSIQVIAYLSDRSWRWQMF